VKKNEQKIIGLKISEKQRRSISEKKVIIARVCQKKSQKLGNQEKTLSSNTLINNEEIIHVMMTSQ